MEIRWGHCHIAQLRDLEHEGICLVFGVLKAAFVVALESLFFGAACHQPIVLGDTKFLEALTTYGDTVVASGTTGVDEGFQPLLGLGAQGIAVAFQVTVKRRGCQQGALKRAYRFAPVLSAQRFGVASKSFVKPRLVTQQGQLFFGLLVSGIAIGHETGQRLDGLLFHAGTVAAVVLGHQQRSVEHRGGVARQHLAMNPHGQGQAVAAMVSRVVATDTALATIARNTGFEKQRFAKRHTVRGKRSVFQGRTVWQRLEQGLGLVEQGLVVAGGTCRCGHQQCQTAQRGRRYRGNQHCPFTHDYP